MVTLFLDGEISVIDVPDALVKVNPSVDKSDTVSYWEPVHLLILNVILLGVAVFEPS